MKNNSLTYYAQAGSITVPGPYAYLFADLPTGIPTLVKTVQGVMLHIFWAEAYGLKLTEERKTEVNLRHVNRQLARILELDDRPLTEARPHERKLVGNCRDFSVMLTAILRHQGVPARARCGCVRRTVGGVEQDRARRSSWGIPETARCPTCCKRSKLWRERFPRR